MGKNADNRGPDNGAQIGQPARLPVERRRRRRRRGAGGRRRAKRAPKRKRQIKWDLSADVVMIGAGVSGLAAAISARDSGASVISVEENFDIGGRGMLSGGRVHLGGGHALQQKAGIKDLADQVFKDWIRFDSAVARYSDRDLVRVFADENVPTFNFLVENGVEFIEKPIGPEAASTVPRTFVTVEWQNQDEIYAPGGDRNGSGLVRAAGAERAQEGRADPAAPRDEEYHPRAGQLRQGLGHHGRASGRHAEHPGQQGRHHRDRRPYRQRQLPPHLRSAPDRGISAGLPALRVSGRQGRARRHGHRRVAVGDRQPDQRVRRRHHQDAAHRLPLGLQLAGVPAREQAVPARQGHRPHGQRLAEHDLRQPERPAVLERGRRLLSVLRGRHGAINGDTAKLNGGGPIWAIFDADAAAREKWDPKPPHVDPGRLLLQRRHARGAGRPRSRIRTRRRRSRAPSCRRP